MTMGPWGERAAQPDHRPVDIGGVTVAKEDIAEAIDILENDHSTNVKQPLRRRENPLWQTDYHGIARAYYLRNPKLSPGTPKQHVAHVKTALLHVLREQLETLGQASTRIQPVSPVEQAVAAVEEAAGKVGHKGGGQGYQVDPEVRKAVEDLAMNAAITYYSVDWQVEDVHRNESFDLICQHGTEVKHVEVKGTTTDGREVILTPNEVAHARSWPACALFILGEVKVTRSEEGEVSAAGGIRRIYDPWTPDVGTLIPIGYRYQVPVEGTMPAQNEELPYSSLRIHGSLRCSYTQRALCGDRHGGGYSDSRAQTLQGTIRELL